jgi:hypothetical protein
MGTTSQEIVLPVKMLKPSMYLMLFAAKGGTRSMASCAVAIKILSVAP